MSEKISQSEYAKLRGCSQAIVSRKMKEGKLSFETLPDGRKVLDPEVADREWAENSDLQIGSVKTDSHPDPEMEGVASYPVSRAMREEYQAKLAKIEFDLKAGNVVKAEAVRQEAFARGRALRDAVLAIPDRLTAELCAITDPHEMHTKLTLELTKALEHLSATGG